MKIMIKIGTTAIFDEEKKQLKEKIIEGLAKDISYLIEKDNEIIIVSSGAVGSAKNIVKGEKGIGLKQAQASVGQIKLMSKYDKIFSKYNLHIAQFLLNSKDLEEKDKIENIKETYKYLKENKVVPIVNENDVTSTDELKIGDNDTLASRLLINLNFDVLIVLTEIGALRKDKKNVINSNFFEVKDYDNMNISTKGFGGLQSKLDAAKKIVNLNKRFIIAKAGDSIENIILKKVKTTEFEKE